MSVSVVIPVYNSESSLGPLVSRLLTVLNQEIEIILVNDGSRDHSWEVITNLARQYPVIRGINLMRNYGQHNAILCGIRAARFDVIITLDDDLQNPPEEIPRLLEKIANGYDVVYGTPSHEKHGIFRVLASRITKFVLQKAMGAETARGISAFRAFRTHLREAFREFRGPYVSIDVLLTWGGMRFLAIPVKHNPRTYGESNYSAAKLMVHALNLMTGFSTFPLQIASLVGFALTLFGVGILAYVIWAYLFLGHSVPGFPFLASVIAIFSGAQLFALGIIGEYLARLHFRSMDRPTYTVEQTTDAA